jgi:hypothetical protein
MSPIIGISGWRQLTRLVASVLICVGLVLIPGVIFLDGDFGYTEPTHYLPQQLNSASWEVETENWGSGSTETEIFEWFDARSLWSEFSAYHPIVSDEGVDIHGCAAPCDIWKASQAESELPSLDGFAASPGFASNELVAAAGSGMSLTYVKQRAKNLIKGDTNVYALDMIGDLSSSPSHSRLLINQGPAPKNPISGQGGKNEGPRTPWGADESKNISCQIEGCGKTFVTQHEYKYI